MSRQLLIKINNRKRPFLCNIIGDLIRYDKLRVIPSLEWYENELLECHTKLSIGDRIKIKLYQMDETPDIVWSGRLANNSKNLCKPISLESYLDNKNNNEKIIKKLKKKIKKLKKKLS